MADRNRELVGSINLILTKFVSDYKNGQLIADLVAPKIMSLTETGTLYIMGKNGFKLYNTNRAIRGNPSKMDIFPSTDTFTCTEKSLGTELDYEREIKVAEKYGAKEVLKMKQRSLQAVSRSLGLAHEKAVADVLFGTSYYDSSYRTALTTTDCWDDYVNSNPITQIEDGKETARGAMGIEPNTLVLGYASFKALKQHPLIIAKLKTTTNAVVTIADLKEILDIPNIVVGQAVYADDDGDFTDIWADSAALIYTPNSGELVDGVPAHSITIEEIGYPIVKEGVDKVNWWADVYRKDVVKNINDKFGYLISNTVA